MFTVYKTTNKLNKEYYIGVHKTDNPNDDYLGSGLRLNYSINKYGKHNFIKKVLYTFKNKEEAYLKEIKLLKYELGKDNNLNIDKGGQGGNLFGGYKHSDKTKEKM